MIPYYYILVRMVLEDYLIMSGEICFFLTSSFEMILIVFFGTEFFAFDEVF
jgi:hypothetical protein